MTVASTQNRKTFAGDDATTSFATTPIVFFATSDLQVYVTTDATGASTLLTEGTHYTVSGGDESVGATGTVDTSGGSSPHGALLAGTTLVILRELPLTQGADFVNNDASDAGVAEAALDKLVMSQQRLDEKLDRSLRLADGDVTGLDPTLPALGNRGDKVLGFNTAGDELELKGAVDNTLLAAQLASTAEGNGAAMIGFAPSGSGAIPRTIQAKAREIVSVTDFGATGDGSTDDSAAFTNAKGSLSAYGGEIFLPPPSSSYKLASAVNMTARCKWVGGGKLAVPIVCGASNSAFTATFTGGYLEFENLFIQGAATTGTTGSAFNIVGTDDSNHMTFLRIVNCYIKDFSAPIITKFADHIFFDDVYVYQGVSGLVTGPMIKHSFGTGITWSNVKTAGAGATLPALAARIGSNVDTFIAGNGTQLYRCGGVTIDNVETGTTFAPRYIRLEGVVVESGKSSSSTNDTCFNVQAGNDIKLLGCSGLAGYYGALVNGGNVVEFLDCTFYANQQHTVFINGGTNVRVHDSFVYDGGQATDNTYRGILVSASVTKFSLRGNTIRSQVRTGSGNKMSYGISIGNNCSDFAVTDNELGNFGTAAWNLGTGHSNYSYRGNRVDGAPTQGSFTCDADTSTTVTNTNVHAYAVINLQARDTAAAGLTNVFVATKTANTSFAVTHSTGAGTEVFDYAIQS